MKFPDPPPETNAKDTITTYAMVAGLLLLASPLIFLALVVRTFVLSVLWSWYLVPHFGVEPLPMIIAFGISLFSTYLLWPFMNHQEDTRTWKQKLATSVFVPFLFLSMGWLGTWFM